MARRTSDPDYRLFTTIAGTLKKEYVSTGPDPWSDSPFSWIRSEPSRRRAKIAEQLVEDYCKAKGLHVTRSPDSEADRLIEGHRVEIKSSTLWEGGDYAF